MTKKIGMCKIKLHTCDLNLISTLLFLKYVKRLKNKII